MRIDLLTRFVLTIGLLSILQLACNDPAAIDTDLLNEDLVNVQFINDFSLQATTVVEDSIKTYNVGSELSRYICGNYTDPIFGRTEASIYGQLIISNSDPAFFKDGSILDSVVLNLAYTRPNGVYGDSLSNNYGLEFYKVTEEMPEDVDYYSSQTFETEATSIGDVEFSANSKDSLDIIYYKESDLSTITIDTVKSVPQIRAKLNYSFGVELLELDSTFYSNSDNFIEALKGIHIKSNTENGGILGFDLASTQSRLTLYYKVNGEPFEYNYYFSANRTKVVHYEHDYSGSVVEGFLNDATKGDSLAFLQGMAGTNVRLDFSDITKLNSDTSKVIVNKALLEFHVAKITEDVNGLYENPERIITVQQGDSTFLLVEDLLGVNIDAFGGTPQFISGAPQKYTINLSAHVQEMIDGESDNSLFLRSFPKPSAFSRAVLYGANHSQFPMKLSVTYTQLK